MADEVIVKTIVERPDEYPGSEITYRSYSGTDITATMIVPNEAQPLVLGDLQTLSYSIHREAKPVRLLGNVNPVSFVQGPRTIAGSLIFVNFEKYTFYRLQQYGRLVHGTSGNGRSPMYPLADMLPLFDIVITASNEYGSFSRMKISGVQIVDEGGTMSIEDLVTENQYTFMASAIEPWTEVHPQFVSVTPNIKAVGPSGPLPDGAV